MCNRARATVWYTFCRPSKSAPTMPVFCDLYVKPSSRYSLVRISQTSSSKTVPIRQFFAILNCKSSSRCRSCTFCRHHLQKVFRTWHFFNIFKCKSSCLYSPVRFLSTTLPDRTQEPQKTETLLQRPRKPLYPKKQGFCAWECFHPWLHAFPNCYSSLRLPHLNCSCSPCFWHDDADLKMTWCQDCPWMFVGSSEIFERNFLWTVSCLCFHDIHAVCASSCNWGTGVHCLHPPVQAV